MVGIPGRSLLLLEGLVVATIVVTGVLMRRARRLPLLRTQIGGVVADASWCSGASSGGLFGRSAWVNNALWVAVTDQALHVGAHFPFNVLLPPAIFDVDLIVPLAAIKSIERRHAWLRGPYVVVSYTLSASARRGPHTRSLELRVRGCERVVDALETHAALAPPRA